MREWRERNEGGRRELVVEEMRAQLVLVNDSCVIVDEQVEHVLFHLFPCDLSLHPHLPVEFPARSLPKISPIVPPFHQMQGGTSRV